jgi:TPP-dependent pyruvate/acetoin dehydrogenase alpha subunit
MRSEIVDGNDVLEVVRTTRAAVEHARAGKGPVLVEAKTMRMLGHAQHDSAAYVPQVTREQWKQRDPLARFEKWLTEKKLWDPKIKKEIDDRIAREIRADVEFAENSPVPPPETAAAGVYCEGCHQTVPEWRRPKEELLPPRSNVKAEWPVRSVAANGARPPAARTEATARKAGKKPSRAPARAKVGR